ncbi:MAG: hypothetical protein ACHQSE_13555, partial [Gemmatimonadales bacterium]
SICLDILAVEPANQEALRVLLLARCDQFAHDTAGAVQRARETLAALSGDYERAYYAGLIHERRAKARLQQRAPGAGFVAYEWLREAMTWYEKAESLRPAGNDDAVLRWNTCARILNETPGVVAREDEQGGGHTLGE